MKDQRFIELLNLYIDRQISPDEAKELEGEIQASPLRQQTYRQYCKMHRATKLVYESFREHSDVPRTEVAVGEKSNSTRFNLDERRGKFKWAYLAGGLAAAACLTLVVARFQIPDSRAVTGVSVADASAKQENQLAAKLPQAVASAPVGVRGGMVSLKEGMSVETDYSAIMASVEPQDRSLSSSQMPVIRLQPLFDDGVFDQRQLSPHRNSRVYRGRGATNHQSAAEFTAFQFQR